MKHHVEIYALLVALACASCSSNPPPAPADEQPAPKTAESEHDPDDPGLLRRPFTAEQIRDEWVAGLSMDVELTGADGVSLQRWTVLTADDEGARIEYAMLDGEGGILGEPEAARSTWIELRDHASFPAVNSRRERLKLATALGTLDGWLYTVRDPAAGTTSEFFFADTFPGAPVQVVTRHGGVQTEGMRQLARQRPE